MVLNIPLIRSRIRSRQALDIAPFRESLKRHSIRSYGVSNQLRRISMYSKTQHQEEQWKKELTLVFNTQAVIFRFPMSSHSWW
jgi:hypothetical protein